MRTSRAIALLVPSAFLVIACDAPLNADGAGLAEEEGALEAEIPLDGPALPAPVCLPVSAFGSDVDHIDACMDCVEGARCTVAQFDAGCCAVPAPLGGSNPAPSPSPGAATGAAIDAVGGGAIGGAAPLAPEPSPPLGPRSSG